MSKKSGFTTTSLHSRGFTLIELLVVVSIIGILMTIGIANYATVLDNARDSKRKSDLKFIQSALEQYHADQKYYPATLNFGSPLTFGLGTGQKTYLKEVPQDPIGSTTTQYQYKALLGSCDNSSTFCQDYCLYAKMGNNDNVINPAPSSCPYSGTYTNYNYALTPP